MYENGVSFRRVMEAIREERTRERTLPPEAVLERVLRGDGDRAAGNLLFHTEPGASPGKLAFVLDGIREAFPGSDAVRRRRILRFLVELAVDMRSWLSRRPLAEPADRPSAEGKQVAALLDVLNALDRENAAAVRRDVLAEIGSRWKAEGAEAAPDSNREVDSLGGCVSLLVDELAGSNLLRAAAARRRGESPSELGNDYAVFLKHMLRLGGSFVTTNPVLIKLAWDIEPERWDSRVDRLVCDAPDRIGALSAEPPEALEEEISRVCSRLTMEVVEENCRLLRDIYLVTEGREGYVSLQVDPRNHGDAAKMVREAEGLYESLCTRLDGPANVVFKLPATAAGLTAAGGLTSEGIGVTITVSFSVFQALAFAEVLDRGRAAVSYIALMNGRMAFPVRDELLAKGIPGAADAARWAGVEVARKSHRLIYGPPRGGGADPNKVKLLIASLRVYGDWLPDISELWGTQVITFFPDVRRKYDEHPREFHGDAIYRRTPFEAMEVLRESEIFRQAWWVPGDPDEQRPRRPLSVESRDGDALLAWPPVKQTLDQFVREYRLMGEKVKARMSALGKIRP